MTKLQQHPNPSPFTTCFDYMVRYSQKVKEFHRIQQEFPNTKIRKSEWRIPNSNGNKITSENSRIPVPENSQASTRRISKPNQKAPKREPTKIQSTHLALQAHPPLIINKSSTTPTRSRPKSNHCPHKNSIRVYLE